MDVRTILIGNLQWDLGSRGPTSDRGSEVLHTELGPTGSAELVAAS